MEIASETERKYDVPDGFELPSLVGTAGVRDVSGAETHELDATYFDTDELALMRNRLTLRRRTGGGDAGWHLKTPGSGNSRTEHRLPLESGENGGDHDQVPAQLHGLVRAVSRRESLKPIARLRTHRVETPLRDAKGRTLALIAQDQVTAESDGREQRWQELEVELVDGDPAVLDAVEKRLLKVGARPAEGPSKVSRALKDRLARAPKSTKVKGPVFGYAREQRDALAEYDPGVRQGDPEAVHKMRVATRRLRSTLKTFKRSFPGFAEVGDELKWLADLLGQVRDGQVQKGKLLAGVDESGPEFAEAASRIRQHLDDQVEQGRAALAEALESERYLALLDRVDRLSSLSGTGEPRPIRRAAKSLAKADALLDKALADGEDHELHDARKAYKRARYAVEVFAADAGRPGKRLVNALTDLQDVLGAHQDSVVARELLHELGPDSFSFGVLWARQEQVGRDTYRELPVVVENSRKKNLRQWMG